MSLLILFDTLKINGEQVVEGLGAWDGIQDSECKISHEISNNLGDTSITGTIKLFTELPPCEVAVELYCNY